MITIQNIAKLYKSHIGIWWRIGEVQTLQTAYLITLLNPHGESLQIYLKRNRIGIQYELELWCWDRYQNNSQRVKGKMLDIDNLKTPKDLIQQIEELMGDLVGDFLDKKHLEQRI
jgi:hypothetical protein